MNEGATPAAADQKPLHDPAYAALGTVLALAAELSVRGCITFPALADRLDALAAVLALAGELSARGIVPSSALADRLELMAAQPNTMSFHADDMREVAAGLRRDMARALADLERADQQLN
jgi:hypothetical protein